MFSVDGNRVVVCGCGSDLYKDWVYGTAAIMKALSKENKVNVNKLMVTGLLRATEASKMAIELPHEDEDLGDLLDELSQLADEIEKERDHERE